MKLKKIISIMLVLMLAVSGCSSSTGKSDSKNEDTKKEAKLPDISIEDAKKNVSALKYKITSTTVDGKMESKMTGKGIDVLISNTINGKYLKKEGKDIYFASIDGKTTGKANGADVNESEKFKIFIEPEKPALKKLDGQEYKEISDSDASEYTDFLFPTMLKTDIPIYFIVLMGDLTKLEQDESTYTLSINLNSDELKKFTDSIDEKEVDTSMFKSLDSLEFKIVMDKKNNLPKEQVCKMIIGAEALVEGGKGEIVCSSKFISLNDLKELKIN